jgi:hypothetical protein
MSRSGESVRRIAGIAAPVLRTDIHDDGFRMLRFDFKRGNERIFGIHNEVVRFTIQLKSNHELHRNVSSIVIKFRGSPMS